MQLKLAMEVTMRKKNNKYMSILGLAAEGILLSVVLFIFLLIRNADLNRLLLSEALPGFSAELRIFEPNRQATMKVDNPNQTKSKDGVSASPNPKNSSDAASGNQQVNPDPSSKQQANSSSILSAQPGETNNTTNTGNTSTQLPNSSNASASAQQGNAELAKTSNLIGVKDIIFQPETDNSNLSEHFNEEPFNIEKYMQEGEREKLKDMKFLRDTIYVVDKKTAMTPEMFNIDALLSEQVSINKTGNLPKVLIFHTHGYEGYADSTGDADGIMGMGELLAQTLTNKYGLVTLHDLGRYDLVDGKVNVNGAYERMEPSVLKILEANPSIEFLIDLHRDGVADNTHLVTKLNGMNTAQIMFVNGLSLLNENGVLRPIKSLENPNINSNLALSLNMKMVADGLYPGFSRKIYLNAYRYSLHLMPKSLLIELGAQTNTVQEAKNAVEPLARVIAEVVQ